MHWLNFICHIFVSVQFNNLGPLDLPCSFHSSEKSYQNQSLAQIRRGEKIGAVKLYRERTGVGLKEAVDAIEAMQRGEQPRRHTAVEAIPAEFPDVVSLIEQGKQIAAIKLYREKTGAGLAKSKAAVEALAVQRGITFPRSGCAGVVLACVVLGFVVARVLC